MMDGFALVGVGWEANSEGSRLSESREPGVLHWKVRIAHSPSSSRVRGTEKASCAVKASYPSLIKLFSQQWKSLQSAPATAAGV